MREIFKSGPTKLVIVLGVAAGSFGLSIILHLVISLYTGLSHSTCLQRQGRVLSMIIFYVLNVWPMVGLLVYRQYRLTREFHPELGQPVAAPNLFKFKITAWLAGCVCLLPLLILAGKLGLWPPVMFAVRNDSSSLVSAFMSIGFNSQTSDLCGRVSLPYASLVRNGSMVKLLIDLGTPIDSEDEQGMTAVGYEVMHGQQEMVKYLINHGAYLEGTKGGQHPLAFAVVQGPEMVKLLLDNGAKVNTKTAHGTALSAAVRANKPEVVNLLFQYGAEPDVRTASNQTPLMEAAQKGYQELVIILLDNGANPFLKDYQSQTAISLAKNSGHRATAEIIETYLPQVKLLYKSQALAESIMDGDLGLIKLLVTSGVDLSEKDLKFGKPALHLALGRNRKEISNFLIESGADVNSRDKYGRTPLMEASTLGELNLVKLLLSKGADPAAQDDQHQTAAILAAKQGHQEIVTFLRSYDRGTRYLHHRQQ